MDAPTSPEQSPCWPRYIRIEFFLLALVVAITTTWIFATSQIQSSLIASESNPANEYDKAKSLLLKGKYTEARAALENLAKNGDTSAHLELAKMYRQGSGVKRDDRVAFEHFLAAAKKDNNEAKREVAESYAYGYGVKRNVAKASEWYARIDEAPEAIGSEGKQEK